MTAPEVSLDDPRSEETFERLLLAARESDEFDTRSDVGAVAAEEEIWRVAEPELQVLQRAQDEYRHYTTSRRGVWRRRIANVLGWPPMRVVLGILLLVFVGTLIAELVSPSFRSQNQGAAGSAIVGLVLFITFAGTLVVYPERFRAQERALRGGVETARRSFEDAVQRKAILPLLRQRLNARTPSYDVALSIEEAPGLRESFAETDVVPTEAQQRVDSFIERTGGGSIGLAGPRGAGKTTLIQRSAAPGSMRDLPSPSSCRHRSSTSRGSS